MCMNDGYNYEKAFQNTVDVCKQLMKKYNIPASRVIQHYDVCAKNCPSVIRAKGEWTRFKQLISAETVVAPITTPTATVDKYYRIRKAWTDSKSQIGAYKSLENAKKDCKDGYTVFDWNGKAVYTKGASEVSFRVQVTADDLRIRKAPSLNAEILGYTGKGTFTIIKTSGDWGYLKSGAGWINIVTKCVKRL